MSGQSMSGRRPVTDSVLESLCCNENGMPLKVKHSLTNLIGNYVRLMVQETSDSLSNYAVRVVDDYRTRIPEAQQEIRFSNTGDTIRDLTNWLKVIQRYVIEIDGSQRCPADIVESLIAGLIQPYQSNCRRAIANRLGYVGVPLLDGDGSAACYGEFLKETGEAIAAVSKLYYEHDLNSADRQHIPKAIKEISEARQQLANMQMKLETALAAGEGSL